MKEVLLSAAIACGVSLFAQTAYAKAPCEETLKEVRTARDVSKLAVADAAKVDDLIAKGIERCNADDDNRSNDFFQQAMTAMGK
jgi:DNA-binding ferritin-like protein